MYGGPGGASAASKARRRTQRLLGCCCWPTRNTGRMWSPLDCQASILETRGRTWDTGAEVYFKIPDWSPGAVVTSEVGSGITSIDQCWNIREGSKPHLQNGVLTFELGALSKGVRDPGVVGCILNGALLQKKHNVPVSYHGPHCFALPPPPPVTFEECSPDFRFTIESEWGGRGGWTARVLLHADSWRAGKPVRIILPESFDEASHVAGTEGTAILGTSTRIQEVFNAKLKGSHRLSFDFELSEASQSSCGEKADNDHVQWGCFTFHAAPAPPVALVEGRTKLMCPLTHPVAPPPPILSPTPSPPPARWPPPPPPLPQMSATPLQRLAQSPLPSGPQARLAPSPPKPHRLPPPRPPSSVPVQLVQQAIDYRTADEIQEQLLDQLRKQGLLGVDPSKAPHKQAPPPPVGEDCPVVWPVLSAIFCPVWNAVRPDSLISGAFLAGLLCVLILFAGPAIRDLFCPRNDSILPTIPLPQSTVPRRTPRKPTHRGRRVAQVDEDEYEEEEEVVVEGEGYPTRGSL